jgi:hypothetical protein
MGVATRANKNSQIDAIATNLVHEIANDRNAGNSIQLCLRGGR